MVGTQYKGHLELKHLSAEQHNYKDHAPMSYVQHTGLRTPSRGYDNDIVAEHDIEIHDTSIAFYGYAHFS